MVVVISFVILVVIVVVRFVVIVIKVANFFRAFFSGCFKYAGPKTKFCLVFMESDNPCKTWTIANKLSAETASFGFAAGAR